MNTTVHVCKFDPRFSSRLLLQMEWDEHSIVLCRYEYNNKTNLVGINKKKYEFIYLTLRSLLDTIKKIEGTYIFHMQSSLTYLLVTLAVRILRKKNIKIIYDLHDINDCQRGVTYGYFRFLIFYIIEWMIAFMNVSIITVSPGLSRIMFQRYGIKAKIVYSIHPRIEIGQTKRKGNNLLYFGLLNNDRLPIKYLNYFGENSISIDFYGRLFAAEQNYIELTERLKEDRIINDMGEYEPENLEFLLNYQYCLLLFEKTLNHEFCLPNKLFQALRYGLCVVISPSLVEILELFRDFPDFVISIKKEDDLKFLLNSKKKTDCERVRDVNDYLDVLIRESRNRYLSALGCNI